MLKNTFCHVPGIGLKTEIKLWEMGICGWDDYLKIAAGAGPAGEKLIRSVLEESIKYLNAGNPGYFEKLLPSKLHWRLFPHFRSQAAYLDIETSGLDIDCCEITTIALYDGKSIFYYVQGENLEEFPEDILKYQVIVTYNGKCFDVPFLERRFRIPINQTHIDLRFVLNSLGYKGGLKSCERKLGIERGDLAGIDGFFSVLLWDDYVQNNNPKALETLLAYNIADVVNLESLMITAYNLSIKNVPFGEKLQIPAASPPESMFVPHLQTIEKIRTRWLVS